MSYYYFNCTFLVVKDTLLQTLLFFIHTLQQWESVVSVYTHLCNHTTVAMSWSTVIIDGKYLYFLSFSHFKDEMIYLSVALWEHSPLLTGRYVWKDTFLQNLLIFLHILGELTKAWRFYPWESAAKTKWTTTFSCSQIIICLIFLNYAQNLHM